MANLRKITRKIKRAVLRDEPGYYDMFENRGERFFARLYLHQIEKVLRERGCRPPLQVLDAGCQSGRLSIPLAKTGYSVTGVDTSAVALTRLKRHAKEAGVSLRLIHANLSSWLPKQAASSFDVVLCTEVLYLRENNRVLLQGLLRILRPGGLLFFSHRPTGYYLAEAFQHRDWEAVKKLLAAKEGTLFGSYYNWQDREDLEALYGELGTEVIEITPIGFLSWLAVNPEELDETGQDLLFQTELASHKRCSGSGRYLLVCARKKGNR